MRLSISKEEFMSYTLKQINTLFPDNRPVAGTDLIGKAFNQALERVEYCFKYVKLGMYANGNEVYLSHLHSDQYTVFLWFFSNSAFAVLQDAQAAEKIFCLNKSLNGFLAMYDLSLPDIFLVLHGVGTHLGRARYDDYFLVCHNCTVGAADGKYPVLGKGVAMAPGSAIVGECKVDDFSTVGANALLRNRNLEKNSVFFYNPENGGGVKHSNTPWVYDYFKIPN